MALTADQSADVDSHLAPASSTNSAVYTMSTTVAVNVESVIATIDNTAGGDTTATLTIRDQAGRVIATKRQGDVIPAGDTGTATYALRLDDNDGAIRFNKQNRGGWLFVQATGTDPATGNGVDISAVHGLGIFAGVLLPAFTITAADMTIFAGGTIDNFIGQAGSGNKLWTIHSGNTTVTGQVLVQISGLGDYLFSLPTSRSFKVRDHSLNDVLTVGEDHSFLLSLKTGNHLTVTDNSGNPIFRVDETGALHGKTGQTLTFDLQMPTDVSTSLPELLLAPGATITVTCDDANARVTLLNVYGANGLPVPTAELPDLLPVYVAGHTE